MFVYVTALRGAAILRTRLQKGYGTTAFALAEEKGECNESNIFMALNFVSRGGELLKRTRKGTLNKRSLLRNFLLSLLISNLTLCV